MTSQIHSRITEIILSVKAIYINIERERLWENITICISNLVNAGDRAHNDQANYQQKPVYDWDIDLTHELSRCMNDFQARETTKSSWLLYAWKCGCCHSSAGNQSGNICYEEDWPKHTTYMEPKSSHLEEGKQDSVPNQKIGIQLFGDPLPIDDKVTWNWIKERLLFTTRIINKVGSLTQITQH